MLYDERAVLGFREAVRPCRQSPFQSWSELIHPPGLKWRGFHPLKFVCQFFNSPRCRDCSQHWQRYARSKTPDFLSCWDQWRHEIMVNGNCRRANAIGVEVCGWKSSNVGNRSWQGRGMILVWTSWRDSHTFWHRVFHSMTLQLQFPLVYDAFSSECLTSVWLSGWINHTSPPFSNLAMKQVCFSESGGARSHGSRLRNFGSAVQKNLEVRQREIGIKSVQET